MSISDYRQAAAELSRLLATGIDADAPEVKALEAKVDALASEVDDALGAFDEECPNGTHVTNRTGEGSAHITDEAGIRFVKKMTASGW